MDLITKIKADKRVESVSDERNNGDGIWIYLKTGYFNIELETNCVHEQTLTKAFSRLRSDVKNKAA